MSLVQVVLWLVGYPENDGETRERPLGSRQRFDAYDATSGHRPSLGKDSRGRFVRRRGNLRLGG